MGKAFLESPWESKMEKSQSLLSRNACFFTAQIPSLPSKHNLSNLVAHTGLFTSGAGSCSGDPTYSLCQTVILTTLLPSVFNFTSGSFPLPQTTLFCMITGDNIHHDTLKRARYLAPSLKNDHKLVFNDTISLLIDNMLLTPMVFHSNPGRNLSLGNRLNRFILVKRKKKKTSKKIFFTTNVFKYFIQKNTKQTKEKIQCSGIFLSWF